MTPAIDLLKKNRAEHHVLSYEHDPKAPSYGLEAAEKLNLDPARVFKTLLAEVDGDLVVAIVPVTGQLDLKALAVALSGKRAVLADPQLAQRRTGYVVGGISPIGQRTHLPTILDRSALGHATILVSGGRRGLDLELAPVDLIAVTDARTAPIARAPKTVKNVT